MILAAAQEKVYAIGKLNLETVAFDSELVESKKVANLPDTTDTRNAEPSSDSLNGSNLDLIDFL